MVVASISVIDPATKCCIFSRRVPACGKASKCRCSHPAASFDNAVRRRVHGDRSFVNNKFGISRMRQLFVAAFAKGMTIGGKLRLDLVHS